MVKTRAGNLDAEAVADGEIAGGQATGIVELWEHDGLVRAKERLPFRTPSLKCSGVNRCPLNPCGQVKKSVAASITATLKPNEANK